MIDDAARTIHPAKCVGGESHGHESYRHRLARALPACGVPRGHTVAMAANITYGTDIADEHELRLCGDVSGAKRVVELGISDWFNAVEFARAGARAIAVDPDGGRIAQMRRRADEAEVTVQCLEGDLADLGDIASTSCEVVLAAQTILDVDDLGRLLRQVHRILKPSTAFVIAMPHPFAAVSSTQPYGAAARTIGGWFTALERSNFRVDQVTELGVGPTQPVPTTLVLRALKQGN